MGDLGVAGRQAAAIEEVDAGPDGAGAVVDADAATGGEDAAGAALAGDFAVAAGEEDVDGFGGFAGMGSGEESPAMDAEAMGSGHGEVGDVEGGAHAGQGGLHGGVVVLDGADVGGFLAGLETEIIADLEAAAGEGAGDDGADAFDLEGAIDGEDRFAEVGGRGGVGEEAGEFGADLVEALALRCADGDDGGAFEGGALQAFADELGGECDILDEVGLGEGDDGAGDAEVGKDVEVFLGLRHPAIVCGDDEESGVHAADPGDHVVDEIGVAGDIDDAEFVGEVGGLGIGEGEVGEAEFDGHAAEFFLGESIGIGAGESADQGGLAVVDVAGGAEDEVAGFRHLGRSRRCGPFRSRRESSRGGRGRRRRAGYRGRRGVLGGVRRRFCRWGVPLRRRREGWGRGRCRWW